jgi:thiol-disulfide isomerase/thioredoxin
MHRLFAAAVFASAIVPAVCALAAERSSEPLMVGDQAPMLAGAKWLRGGPVDEWQAGHVYLLDFWATWCAPCLQMMPSHQALEDRYGQERFHVVGLAIWSDDGPMTPARALEKHPSLRYAVVEDKEGRFADLFMGGTGTRGLPTFMLIDRKGRLAWVGEPGAEFEEVLAENLGGSFDLQAARKQDQVRREGQALFARIDELRGEDRPREAAELVDKVVALDERRNGWAWAMKYEILADDCDDPAAAMKTAERFLGSDPGRNPFFNYAFALRITRGNTPDRLDQRELDLGVHLARRAVDLAAEPNPDYLANLARVHFLRGEFKEATQWQKRAIDAAPEAQRDSLSRTLREYGAEIDPDS